MSKIILCSGPLAGKPYLMKLTNQHIYSLEELCYILYQNIYVLNNSMFDGALCRWLEQEIDEKKLAKRLDILIREESPVEEKVAAVLGASDYYTENEVKNTVYLMQKMEDCSPVEKWKLKGDSYLEHGSYAQAAQEYEMLLRSEEGEGLRAREYGRIKHNLAIAHLYTGCFNQAAQEFEEAARASGEPVSVLACQEARKLAEGELPEYARVSGQNIREEDYEELIAGWKEELRRAFQRK